MQIKLLRRVRIICSWLSLELNSGLSRSGVTKARNVLKQHGFIEFKSNGTRAASYKLNTISNSVQTGAQNGIQDSVQDGIQNSTALNKQNKTRQNKERSAPSRETLVSEFGKHNTELYLSKT